MARTYTISRVLDTVRVKPNFKFYFTLEIDQYGNAKVMNKDWKDIPPINEPLDINTLRMVPIVIGIPKFSGGRAYTTVISNGGDDGGDRPSGGCNSPCHLGYANGKPACICP